MSIYKEYTKYILSFVNTPIIKWSFKSDPTYCDILEHVSPEIGKYYLMEILRQFETLFNLHKEFFIELCNTNDLYGNPNKAQYEDFTYCSPTNLRYILHGLLVLSYIKTLGHNSINIVEIGGGYGGLCFYIYKMAKLFDITINTYYIFDLPEVLVLQNKYLRAHGFENVGFMNLDDFVNHDKSATLPDNSFLISNYAYSEFSMEVQQKYTKYVLNPFISHGFLTWNFIDVYQFIKNKLLHIKNETPLTCAGNKYVMF
jgi:hypothetical protein